MHRSITMRFCIRHQTAAHLWYVCCSECFLKLKRGYLNESTFMPVFELNIFSLYLISFSHLFPFSYFFLNGPVLKEATSSLIILFWPGLTFIYKKKNLERGLSQPAVPPPAAHWDQNSLNTLKALYQGTKHIFILLTRHSATQWRHAGEVYCMGNKNNLEWMWV